MLSRWFSGGPCSEGTKCDRSRNSDEEPFVSGSLSGPAGMVTPSLVWGATRSLAQEDCVLDGCGLKPTLGAARENPKGNVGIRKLSTKPTGTVAIGGTPIDKGLCASIRDVPAPYAVRGSGFPKFW